MAEFPIEHSNTVLEKISDQYFRNALPIEWVVDQPTDYGIDLIVSLVINNEVIGFNFSVQLKAKSFVDGKLAIRLKKTTLNYLFVRLEPCMVVLYDAAAKSAYWKWLIKNDFDLTQPKQTYEILFDASQTLDTIRWDDVTAYVQRIFKVQNRLLTSLEYDLFNSSSELEVKAWSHYHGLNYPEAISYFRRLLQVKTQPIWLMASAHCEYETYDYVNAIHTINAALEIDFTDGALTTKGAILAEDGIRQKDIYRLKSAEKIFSELYQKSASDVHCYNYANTTYHLGQLEQSEKLYKEALAINPNYAEAWRNLGQLYYDGEKYQQVLDCYNKALSVNPELMQAIVSKGIVLGVGFADYKGALQLLKVAVENDQRVFTKFHELYYWLSSFYTESRNIKKALYWVDRGLAHAPGDFNLRMQKLQVFVHLLRDNMEYLDEAIRFFSENHELNANDSVNYYYLCEALSLKHGEEEIKSKVFEWFERYLPFESDIVHQILEEYQPKDLLNCLKVGSSVDEYLMRYPIEEIRNELHGQHLTYNLDPFLAQFQINRNIFLSAFIEIFHTISRPIDRKEATAELIKSVILSFTTEPFKQMIPHPKEELKPFAEVLASVVSTCSMVIMREFPRCIGFVVDKFDISQRDSIDDLLQGQKLYMDIMLRIMEQLYVAFDLPLE